MPASFIELPGGRRLAYCLTPGTLPGIVFLGGFRSDMTGTKATALEAVCREKGHRFLRFDYSGHGQSSGDFLNCTIGQWKRDTTDMLDQIAPGQNLLVGSSMGAWLMLLAALERPQQVRGLVGIASAPDFTQSLITHALNKDQKKELEEKGVIYLPSCYGQDPFPITLQLIKEAHNHLLLHQHIPIHIPVRLLHGTKDQDVPWQVSSALLECLSTTDATLTLIKNGDHRLSEPAQLEMIAKTVTTHPALQGT